MKIILTVFVSYLLGSFPSGYILARLFYGKDLRKEGSGNVGTLNSLRVTKSKFLSIAVLIIDVAKGYFALMVASFLIIPDYFIVPALAVIIGHMYPVWLGGRGGRGLATLAGVYLFLKPEIVVIWWVIFGLLYVLMRKYIIAGMIALFLVNIFTVLFFSLNIFLILSACSMIVVLKYIPRITEELSEVKVIKGD
jgi:glycerol-3-phosphate acyltransferase PlsY